MFPTTLWPATTTHETIELRDIVKAGVNIWDFDYPSFYAGEAKKAFEQKVIDHFWTRQIGQETVGRFLLYFRRTVREIMPVMIQRYESVEMMKDPEIRPLDNYNMIEEYSQERTDQSSGTSKLTGSGSSSNDETSTGKTGGVRVHSDTPQESLLLPMGTDGNVTLTYASDVEQSRDLNSVTTGSTGETTTETASEDKASATGTEMHRLTRRGNIGVTTYAQLLEGFRESFIDVDLEIIEKLDSCFLGVY